MAREISREVQELMDEMKTTEKTLKKVRADYDERIKLLGKRIADLTKQLRNSDCDHDWVRDPYPYSELYCNHCGVWRR